MHACVFECKVYSTYMCRKQATKNPGSFPLCTFNGSEWHITFQSAQDYHSINTLVGLEGGEHWEKLTAQNLKWGKTRSRKRPPVTPCLTEVFLFWFIYFLWMCEELIWRTTGVFYPLAKAHRLSAMWLCNCAAVTFIYEVKTSTYNKNVNIDFMPRNKSA